ncbi:hypothetical protein HMPREF9151_00291 [Hoylesella saccharolytica F0055]|uniref:Uncharacterized protein n=1 Tax=Hoylesella saccharolytica F0055 TaxID=1127699 RepID=L1NK60_9BACT|nr:hypothetical protein HMPREF9151_00291 [Hoylesella saccharolytica F0055]
MKVILILKLKKIGYLISSFYYFCYKYNLFYLMSQIIESNFYYSFSIS